MSKTEKQKMLAGELYRPDAELAADQDATQAWLARYNAALAVAERHRLPLRGHCGVRPIATFYGQWDGQTHPEGISPNALARIVATEVEDGFNELCCHPGYADADLASSYTLERRTELETLCDPEVAALLGERGIGLVTFRELSAP